MGLLSTRKKLAVLYVCLWWYYWQNLAVTGQWENIQVFKFTPKHFETIIVGSLILRRMVLRLCIYVTTILSVTYILRIFNIYIVGSNLNFYYVCQCCVVMKMTPGPCQCQKWPKLKEYQKVKTTLWTVVLL